MTIDEAIAKLEELRGPNGCRGHVQVTIRVPYKEPPSPVIWTRVYEVMRIDDMHGSVEFCGDVKGL